MISIASPLGVPTSPVLCWQSARKKVLWLCGQMCLMWILLTVTKG